MVGVETNILMENRNLKNCGGRWDKYFVEKKKKSQKLRQIFWHPKSFVSSTTSYLHDDAVLTRKWLQKLKNNVSVLHVLLPGGRHSLLCAIYYPTAPLVLFRFADGASTLKQQLISVRTNSVRYISSQKAMHLWLLPVLLIAQGLCNNWAQSRSCGLINWGASGTLEKKNSGENYLQEARDHFHEQTQTRRHI